MQLKRQYDPRKVAYNVTSQAKIAKFDHEEDSFNDLFVSSEAFSQVKHMAKIKLGAEGLEEFYKLRTQRLETLPIDLLNTTSMVQPQGHIEDNIPEKEKTPKMEQKLVIASEPLDTYINIDPKLITEWEQFDSIISNP